MKPPEEKKEPEETPEDTQRHEVPLDKEVIDQFTETMFSGKLYILPRIFKYSGLNILRITYLQAPLTANFHFYLQSIAFPNVGSKAVIL